MGPGCGCEGLLGDKDTHSRGKVWGEQQHKNPRKVTNSD